MRRTIGIVSALAIVAAIAGWRTTPNQEPTLQGAWVRASTWDTAGNVNSEPQRGLFIFTGTHYSVMFVNSGEPREQFAGDTPTDAELVTAYRSFVANSGRYEVDGDQLTTRAYMAKNPNYMGSWPENPGTFTYRIEGDTLYATNSNGSGATWRRVEGTPVPW